MLKELAENLFIVDALLPFMGGNIGIRMTIIRLSDGNLLVINPVAMDFPLKKQIEEIGRVRFIVAPNRFHHLYVNEFSEQFPNAVIFAAPGLPQRIKSLKYNKIINEGDDLPWGEDVEQIIFSAMPVLNEVVFFHRPSRTLVLTDLSFNIQHAHWSLWDIYIRLSGAYKKFGLSRIMKLFVRDRKKAKELVSDILNWDFDRIIVSHGDIVDTGGKDLLRTAFNWL